MEGKKKMENQILVEEKISEKALKTSGMSYMNMCKMNNSLLDAGVIVLDPKEESISIMKYLSTLDSK